MFIPLPPNGRRGRVRSVSASLLSALAKPHRHLMRSSRHTSFHSTCCCSFMSGIPFRLADGVHRWFLFSSKRSVRSVRSLLPGPRPGGVGAGGRVILGESPREQFLHHALLDLAGLGQLVLLGQRGDDPLVDLVADVALALQRSSPGRACPSSTPVAESWARHQAFHHLPPGTSPILRVAMALLSWRDLRELVLLPCRIVTSAPPDRRLARNPPGTHRGVRPA